MCFLDAYEAFDRVQQGGILSLILFSLYMDDSERLNDWIHDGRLLY